MGAIVIAAMANEVLITLCFPKHVGVIARAAITTTHTKLIQMHSFGSVNKTQKKLDEI